ncbi:HlyD family secretion protein [Desulforamulus aeronauticus]|uniref:HlyD family secretion protein n=1 Tax=Desulforamulus aeronauticus DSM 10349 TaxID=1121421 RepID=A0A1M6P172_9FIRM|nr:HlyD family efflux transporter periplasmic adaptor subunit [Desulforamulus aeronauticus]SHK01676.1 HlyD family secretion protein [Desulforamulus aeronauticus DSM 10349]
MKKRLIVVGLVLVVALAVYSYHRFFPTADQQLTASGTIEATTVELNAKLQGTLTQLNIKAGQQVSKGQLVGQLLRNDLVAQKERDALGVLKAEAQLKDLTSGARAQEIKEATAMVNIALANVEKAQTDFQRGEQLLQEGAITTDSYEKLTTDLQVKQNQLESVRAKLSLLTEGSRPETIRAAQTEVERNKAVLKASEALLEDTKIISPINGTVLSTNREPGEFVQAGTSLATVADLQDMWIRVYVPTDDLPRIKLNQSVGCTVSGSEQQYQGVIEEIASQGEFTPKTIQTKKERTNIVYGVKIRINQQNGTLKPGMPADVIFE